MSPRAHSLLILVSLSLQTKGWYFISKHGFSLLLPIAISSLSHSQYKLSSTHSLTLPSDLQKALNCLGLPWPSPLSFNFLMIVFVFLVCMFNFTYCFLIFFICIGLSIWLVFGFGWQKVLSFLGHFSFNLKYLYFSSLAFLSYPVSFLWICSFPIFHVIFCCISISMRSSFTELLLTFIFIKYFGLIVKVL